MAKLLAALSVVLLVGCNQQHSGEVVVVDEDIDYFEDSEGNRIPRERHIGWPIEAVGVVVDKKFPVDESSRILKRLESEGINVEFVMFYGANHMVWSEKDNDCVRKIIDNQWCE